MVGDVTWVQLLTEPEESHPLTPMELSHHLEEGQFHVYNLMEHLDEATGMVINGEKNKSDWINIMTKVAEFMKGGFHFYVGFFDRLEYLAGRMFNDTHDFQLAHKCHYLVESIHETGYGTKEFFPKVELALAKDLMCFTNLLQELHVMKVSTDPACPPTEDGVIDLIAQSLKDLFRLKNDGEDFFWAVANATHTYDADVHGHFMTELFTKRELVQQLLRVLKSDKDKQ